MKISISNIAWKPEDDHEMYAFLSSQGIDAIEIAPTRIIQDSPYDQLEKAKEYRIKLKEIYDLDICSMQSIWYGRVERIFGSEEERKALIDYTKKALKFAKQVDCHNLVFGCPKNRVISSRKDYDIAYAFFSQLGKAAENEGVVISIEPNPQIYGTNFLNTTAEALSFVKNLNLNSIKINYDMGTVIENSEDYERGLIDMDIINHVHLSEPGLLPISYNRTQLDIIDRLKENGYKQFVSIETKENGDIEAVKANIMTLKTLAG